MSEVPLYGVHLDSVHKVYSVHALALHQSCYDFDLQGYLAHKKTHPPLGP